MTQQQRRESVITINNEGRSDTNLIVKVVRTLFSFFLRMTSHDNTNFLILKEHPVSIASAPTQVSPSVPQPMD